MDEELLSYDEDLRFGLELYKELVRAEDGYKIRQEDVVVEVGCGKGAGAIFLAQKLMPRQYIGIDYSKAAIAFCKKTYSGIANTDFQCADAHRLPFENASIDVLLNVESSHLYKDVEGFFKEASRVLKPGGKFLYTDYRYVKHYPISRIESKLSASGFTIDEKRLITTNIREACLLASQRREELVNELIPPYLRKYFRHYAILKGTKKFNMLGNGEISYFMYRLSKRQRPISGRKLSQSFHNRTSIFQ